MLLAVVAASLAIGLALVGCGGDQDGGEALPDIRLEALADGAAFDWAEGDRPLVVNLWATWCVPCKAEMPAFDRVHRAVGDEVTIVGVTDVADRDAARTFAEESGVTYPLAIDVDQRALVELGISQLPATVFADGEGRILGTHVGPLTEAELLDEIEERYGIQP